MDETLDMKPEDRIEYWKLVMSDFKESTLTRSDYCKQNDIKLSTFDYWRRRLSDLEACSEEDGSRFAELKFSTNELPDPVSEGGFSRNSDDFVTEMIINVGRY
ncbi:MAG: hypothetical protein IJ821_04870 [Lachnospiraceae bacterium]|nr:hypothetical protein [Lachnospiraceae bacterium]